MGHRSCQEPATAPALHRLHLPSRYIHLHDIILVQGPSWATERISVHHGAPWERQHASSWFSPQAASAPGSPPSLPFFTDLGVCRVVPSHVSFYSLSQMLCHAFNLSLNMFSQRCHQHYKWAQLCISGSSWSWLELTVSDKGQSLVSSPKGCPCSPHSSQPSATKTMTYKHWRQKKTWNPLFCVLCCSLQTAIQIPLQVRFSVFAYTDWWECVKLFIISANEITCVRDNIKVEFMHILKKLIFWKRVFSCICQ